MYAALASAGASHLYDLYKSVTSSSSTSSTYDPSSSTTSPTGAVNSTSSSGSSFSSALQKLFVDLQATLSGASTASTADPTTTIADDLQTTFKDTKLSGAHGHHHHAGPPPSDDSQSTSSGDTLSSTAPAATKTNPFQDLASSLIAYAKTQSLTPSTSTSLTA